MGRSGEGGEGRGFLGPWISGLSGREPPDPQKSDKKGSKPLNPFEKKVLNEIWEGWGRGGAQLWTPGALDLKALGQGATEPSRGYRCRGAATVTR